MKFLIHLFTSILLLVTPSFFLKSALENNYDDYKKEKLNIEKTLNSSPDAVILGSSHANSINKKTFEKITGKKIAKFNKAGQDLYESIYIIKSVNKIIKNQVYIISISPFSFHYDNYAYKENGKRSRREKRIRLYSTFNNYNDHINWDFSNIIFSYFYPIVTFDHFEKATHFNDLQDYFNINEAEHNRRRGPKKQSPDNEWVISQKISQLDKHATRRVKLVYQDLIPNMQKNSNYIIHERAFKKFYDLCKSLERDNTFILYTPPYWPSYYDQIPNDIKSFVDMSVSKLAQLPNVFYFDFNDVDIFTAQPFLFDNSDHFSARGKETFTYYFLNKIKELIGPAPI